VTSEEKANAWLITTRKQLEDSAGSESQNPENPEEDRPWEYISSEPPGDREIVKLFFEGHSDREIAELVHAGLRTISNALTRIRRDYAHLNLIRKGNPHIQPRSKKARQQK
jgi:DNA-binding NarL/FixJ family response regulator